MKNNDIFFSNGTKTFHNYSSPTSYKYLHYITDLKNYDTNIDFINCKNINNNFKIISWKYNDIITYMYKDYFEVLEKIKYKQQIYDIFRYIILKDYGGIYLDFDHTCVKQLNINNTQEIFFIGDNIKNIGIHFMGSLKNKNTTSFWENLIENINFDQKLEYYDYIWEVSGPGYIKKYLLNNRNFKYMPKKNYDPCNYCNYDCDKNKFKEDVYLIHRHSSTWSENSSSLKYLYKCKYFEINFLFLFFTLIFYKQKISIFIKKMKNTITNTNRYKKLK